MPVINRCIHSGPPEPGQPEWRPDGIHLSGLVRAALKEAGIESWPERKEGPSLAMMMGLAWEDWYGPRIPGAVYHPGPMRHDGIWFTPDALDCEKRILHEIKLTTKHPKGSPFDVLRWNLQVKGYLWCLGEGEWVTCRLHVLHVGPPPLPRMEIWEAVYEPQELKDAWFNILWPMRDKAEAETHGHG